MPIRNDHIPPTRLPWNAFHAPITIRKIPNAEPHQEAIRVELTMSPLIAQIAARRTRPPSRGNAGTRLNTPRIVLIHARYETTAATPGVPAATSPGAIAKDRPAIMKLVSGPAI